MRKLVLGLAFLLVLFLAPQQPVPVNRIVCDKVGNCHVAPV